MGLKGKTVLVTGATGFLGGALTKRLSADGVQVRALARRPNRDRAIKDLNHVEIVMGDITDAERIKTVVEGCDVVFHVAAALNGKLDYQRKVSVGGTQNVALAAAQAGVKRFVHVSSIAIYGFRNLPQIIHEGTTPTPTQTPYNIAKREAEDALREIAAESNLPYCILRPGMIYGPHSSAWTVTMFKLVQHRPAFFVGDGSGSVHPIYIDDVVDMMIQLATHDAAIKEAFNCTSDTTPTWRQFLGSYANLAGHNWWLGIPVAFVKLIAPLAEIIMRLRGEPQDVPDMVRYLTSNHTYSMEKARSLLGWQPQTDLQTGIENCAPYLRQKGLLK